MISIIDLKFLGQEHVIAAFLVETKEGPVLVETGPHATFPNLENGIQLAGYELSDIRHVFLTHIHLDHAGAAWRFAELGAKIYVHPFGYRHLANPAKLMDSARKIYQNDMDRLWGEMRPIVESQLVSVGHKERIKVGDEYLRGLYSPGHAVHHLAWEFGKVLFSGDVGGVRIGGAVVLPPCPPPDINVEDWRASLSMIKKRRYQSLYLTHFGKVDNVKEHLVELEGRLLNWANWIRPYFDAGANAQAIIPKFQDYVATQLAAKGVVGEDLVRYERANPSWMSVAGLLRYWRKKLS